MEEISKKLLSPSSGKEGRAIILGSKKIFFFQGKSKRTLYKSDVAESKYGNQNIRSLTTSKGEMFKFKNYVFNEKNLMSL
jgi:hypothetical protein